MTPLLLSLLLLLVIPSLSSPPHHHHHHHHHITLSPPPQPPQQQQENQLSDIISTLLSTTDFQTFSTLLLSSAPSLFNITATIFVPSDSSLSHLPTYFDPLLISYHILPNTRLPLSSISLLPPLSRLPTLLPDHYILITNNSLSNFSVDGSWVTKPDLFLSRSFAVHGIRNVLYYSPYFERNESVGNGFVSNETTRPREGESPLGVVGSVWDSGALKGGDGFSIVFLIVFFGVFW